MFKRYLYEKKKEATNIAASSEQSEVFGLHNANMPCDRKSGMTASLVHMSKYKRGEK